MFSKKMVLIVGVIVLIAVNIIVLSVNSRRYTSFGLERVAISFISPFQELVTRSIRFTKDIWFQYFALVAIAKENRTLRTQLNRASEKSNLWRETDMANARLRNLLDFQKNIAELVVAAEVIGKDPSAWFKTVIIDKGKADGLIKGLPVVMPQGIAGQVIEVANHYSKVMLIIDRNSAVDALVQRTRARGVLKGKSTDQCRLDYVLRKKDVRVGDIVVSSGLDGIYPKGLRIGLVSEVVDHDADIFHEVILTPFVDFEKLEEVLVVLDIQKHEFVSRK
ncbi:MAG: rod shape-determining protein MreC [Deltaproteobacteria bacterium]|jgi:rod shape-determining protein MreC|nr:rod shape-determining protein MreC [Deltaproteobacteria bacterium]